MNYLEFYKDQYNEQILKRESISSAISIPLSILTLLVGGLIFYFNKLEYISYNRVGIAFYLLLGAATLALVIALVFLFFIIVGRHKYGYLPLSNEIEEYRQKSIAYYTLVDDVCTDDAIEEMVDKDVEQMLVSLYIQASDMSRKSNIRKLNYLRMLNIFIVISVIVISLTFIPYSLSKKDDVQKIEVVSRINSNSIDVISKDINKKALNNEGGIKNVGK